MNRLESIRPFVPTTEAAQTVYDYYTEALKDPNFMREEVTARFNELLPKDRLAFIQYHADLFPGQLEYQAYAARRTLLADYIAEHVELSRGFDLQFEI